MSQQRFRIGTRASRLALWQAEWVKSSLQQLHPTLQVELVKIQTEGDRILDVPLAKIGGKGLFVKEIEEALLDGRIDLAVHSMKDVPTLLPPGLELRCITERADPRDCLVLAAPQKNLADLPQGARIGTSSLRRRAQLLHKRPDLRISDMRGNVDTRLRKMREEGLDGIVLAAAGLKRLGYEEHIGLYLEPKDCLPAIAQGALGLECRIDDKATHALLAPLHHPATAMEVTAERAFLARLEGGCQVPVAGYAQLLDDRLELTGLVARIDGSEVLKDSLTCPADEAAEVGRALADILLRCGADQILGELYGQAES
ncbi:hydroxymethylbilane synthase [Syntrophotalea acetylenivorans]|uniref:Porphobilinogen deaminase n=1 Tax=Syntrophotalea acetylenivorans TaxID=1842532 RepID=A0A1L3GS70_9BACT|nr:hydroxymethylbilane synthase [Syntrophotalea acetylenivorans]APG28508.1 hydroxymethylbilane synthase [Syntrophotalea acetylenivorans]